MHQRVFIIAGDEPSVERAKSLALRGGHEPDNVTAVNHIVEIASPDAIREHDVVVKMPGYFQREDRMAIVALLDDDDLTARGVNVIHVDPDQSMLDHPARLSAWLEEPTVEGGRVAPKG